MSLKYSFSFSHANRAKILFGKRTKENLAFNLNGSLATSEHVQKPKTTKIKGN